MPRERRSGYRRAFSAPSCERYHTMSAPVAPALSLDEARALSSAGESLLFPALEQAHALTRGGAAIDDHQVVTERVAYAATELRAAREVLGLQRSIAELGRGADFEATAVAAVADLVASARTRLESVAL